jgi:DNA-binding MarR family transcriptional regulator
LKFAKWFFIQGWWNLLGGTEMACLPGDQPLQDHGHAALLNPNQIATLLGLDRTVVHRAVKSLIREERVSEKKAPSGRALLLELTPEGNRYRSVLIQQRRAVDAKQRHSFLAANSRR